jgi:hypothetical protein
MHKVDGSVTKCDLQAQTSGSHADTTQSLCTVAVCQQSPSSPAVKWEAWHKHSAQLQSSCSQPAVTLHSCSQVAVSLQSLCTAAVSLQSLCTAAAKLQSACSHSAQLQHSCSQPAVTLHSCSQPAVTQQLTQPYLGLWGSVRVR